MRRFERKKQRPWFGEHWETFAMPYEVRHRHDRLKEEKWFVGSCPLNLEASLQIFPCSRTTANSVIFRKTFECLHCAQWITWSTASWHFLLHCFVPPTRRLQHRSLLSWAHRWIFFLRRFLQREIKEPLQQLLPTILARNHCDCLTT